MILTDGGSDYINASYIEVGSICLINMIFLPFHCFFLFCILSNLIGLVKCISTSLNPFDKI